jgi:hypothetical protein
MVSVLDPVVDKQPLDEALAVVFAKRDGFARDP